MKISARKPIKKYSQPKYATYQQHRDAAECDKGWLAKTRRDLGLGLLAGTVPFFIAGCGLVGGGQTAGVAPPTKLITEEEARVIIEEEFAKSDIYFENDKHYSFDGLSLYSIPLEGSITADGYNEEHDIVYEYIVESDEDNISYDLEHNLAGIHQFEGPYCLILRSYEYSGRYSSDPRYEILRSDVADYVEWLSSQLPQE